MAMISAGTSHTCGVTPAGVVKCWGHYEQVDAGNRTSLVPVNVMGLSPGVLAVSCGGQACVATSTGGAKCWGVESAVPHAVEGLSSGIVSVSVGRFAACAVRSTGTVRCWGTPGSSILGNGGSLVPRDVEGLSGVVSVSAGYLHVCAVTSAGAVKCWGHNDAGQLGNGSRSGESSVPVAVANLSSGVASVSAGFRRTCAVTSAGAVKCWGFNDLGQLGNGSTDDSPVPVAVEGLSSGVVSISAGHSYTCAVISTGAAKCWGSNMWGGFRVPSTTYTSRVPVDVPGLASDVLSVSVGEFHACAVTSTGAPKCWGRNDFGQLGNGSTIGSAVPVDVLGF